MGIIDQIKEITDVEGFVLDGQAIVDILAIILNAIFGFILGLEYGVEAE